MDCIFTKVHQAPPQLLLLRSSVAPCRPCNLDSGPGLRVRGAGLGPMATPSARASVRARLCARTWAGVFGRPRPRLRGHPPHVRAALVPLTDVSLATVPAALLEVVVRLLKKLWLRNVN